MQTPELKSGDRLIYRHALNLIGIWSNDEGIHTCALPKGIDRYFVKRIAETIAFASGLEILRTIREDPDYIFILTEKM